jgi:hypothetical protein
MGVRIDKFHLRCCLMLSSFRALNLDGDLRVPSIPVQMALAREMQNVSVIAADESKYLESASPVLRGLVIVKLFLLDLIGVPLSPLLSSLIISTHSFIICRSYSERPLPGKSFKTKWMKSETCFKLCSSPSSLILPTRPPSLPFSPSPILTSALVGQLL